MVDILISAPDAAVAIVSGRVEAPRESRGVHLVAQRLVVKTHRDGATVLTFLRNRINVVAAAGARTTPVARRIVDGGAGLTGDDILMRDEAAGIEVRGEHLVGQHVVLAQIKVRLGFGYAARSCTARCCTTCIPSTRCRSRSSGNRCREGCPCRCKPPRTRPTGVRYPKRSPSRSAQRDLLPTGVVSILSGFGLRESVEQIVEAAVLLNDDNDVLDFAAGAMTMNAADEILGAFRHRGNSAVAVTSRK